MRNFLKILEKIFLENPKANEKVLKMPCENIRNRTIKRTFKQVFQTDSIQIP